MRIDKVYNNNLVLAKGEGEEIIVVGRGLGFQKKSGDEIDTSLVEKHSLCKIALLHMS